MDKYIGLPCIFYTDIEKIMGIFHGIDEDNGHIAVKTGQNTIDLDIENINHIEIQSEHLEENSHHQEDAVINNSRDKNFEARIEEGSKGNKTTDIYDAVKERNVTKNNIKPSIESENGSNRNGDERTKTRISSNKDAECKRFKKDTGVAQSSVQKGNLLEQTKRHIGTQNTSVQEKSVQSVKGTDTGSQSSILNNSKSRIDEKSFACKNENKTIVIPKHQTTAQTNRSSSLKTVSTKSQMSYKTYIDLLRAATLKYDPTKEELSAYAAFQVIKIIKHHTRSYDQDLAFIIGGRELFTCLGYFTARLATFNFKSVTVYEASDIDLESSKYKQAFIHSGGTVIRSFDKTVSSTFSKHPIVISTDCRYSGNCAAHSFDIFYIDVPRQPVRTSGISTAISFGAVVEGVAKSINFYYVVDVNISDNVYKDFNIHRVGTQKTTVRMWGL